MTTHKSNDGHLEQSLATLTEYDGKETALWSEALAQCARESEDSANHAQNGIVMRILDWPMQRKLLAVAAIIAIVCAVYVSVQSEFGSGFEPGRDVASAPPNNLRNFGTAEETQLPWQLDADMDTPQRASALPGGGGIGGGGALLSGGGSSAQRDATASSVTTSSADDAMLTSERAVVRKATLHLASKDVRAAYLQAIHMVSEVHGEFVDSSSLEGDGAQARGEITLRIDVNRLNDVLDRLRALGTVVSEQKHGEDVTAQLVDLQARARNESRIEEELLELLADRDDAPLADVLELRRQIARVREQIERLLAQEAHMQRLTRLATVLIILRYEHEPDAVEQPEDNTDDGLSSYFTRNISMAWTSGSRYLADTVAFLVQVLVGGLLWWGIAVVCIVAAVRMRRRHPTAAT